MIEFLNELCLWVGRVVCVLGTISLGLWLAWWNADKIVGMIITVPEMVEIVREIARRKRAKK